MKCMPANGWIAVSSPRHGMRRLHTGPMFSQVYRFVVGTLLVVFFVLVPILSQAQEKKEEIPPRQNITLTTSDGVQLSCAWYAGTKGKQSVPVILLHGWGRVGGDYSALASYLQNRGRAVIVPDLRGHGRSTTIQVGTSTQQLDYKRMNKKDLADMMNDVETLKSFLMEKNNAGELNIELLTLVASDATSIVAVNWAIRDWSWPQLIGRKQGQDVKAVVLLTPVRTFKGATLTSALRHPLLAGNPHFTLNLLIIVGAKDRTGIRDATLIYNSLKRGRPPIQNDVGGADVRDADKFSNSDLVLYTPDVSLRGAKLLEPSLRIDRKINNFIRYRLEANADKYAWTNRSRS